MDEIILSEYGDAVLYQLTDNHELVGHLGTHNKCGGEMHAIPLCEHKAIRCHKCGWTSAMLMKRVRTIGILRDHFRCYNTQKENA